MDPELTKKRLLWASLWIFIAGLLISSMIISIRFIAV